jgi:hypothetical protein
MYLRDIISLKMFSLQCHLQQQLISQDHRGGDVRNKKDCAQQKGQDQPHHAQTPPKIFITHQYSAFFSPLHHFTD